MASPNNLPLRDLQKILLGTRKEPLSSLEIRDLFSYPTTPESILYIITALNKKQIDPNTVLIQAIANAHKREDLIPVALSLRYGADPNLYVNAPNIGDIHILGYVQLISSKKSEVLVNSIVIMLMVMGADPNLPVFDSKGGIVRDEFSLVQPIKGQSVNTWLFDQGFDSIVPEIQNHNYCKVDPKFMTMIITYLDKADMVCGKLNLHDVISSHSFNIFNKMNDHDHNNNNNNPENGRNGIHLSVVYLNLNAFEKYVDLGYDINYAGINDLITSMKHYQKMGDVISLSQVVQFLVYLISHGTMIDKYQEDMLKDVGKNIYDGIMKVYSEPYWKKVCKRKKGKVPLRFKNLAYQLNLYPENPKDTLCYQIRKIMQGDPERTKQSIINRQVTRVRTISSYINEFDTGVPVLNCSNQSVLKGNIYDYPDVDIAFYRDDQENLWCFGSNNYVKILEQKKNPYTVQDFPEDFIEMVGNKMEFIKNYRNIQDDPTPISDVLDDINKPDQIDDKWFENDVREFKEMMVLNGVTEWDIDKLSPNDMEKILDKNFKIVTNLVDLDRKHSVKTFYIVSYDELNKDPSIRDTFFGMIDTSGKNINNGKINTDGKNIKNGKNGTKKVLEIKN